MSWISKAEYSGTITTAIIDVLTGNNDAIIDNLTDESVDFSKCYLRAKYSADTLLFSTTGTTRNKLLMRVVRDISVYNLYSNNYIFKKIPAIREQKYKDALQLLQDAQAERVNLQLYTGTTGQTSYVISGGNSRREDYQL